MKAILSMVQLGSSGDAVARLHEALAWLGFEVDAVERRQRKFDVRTLGHVQKLQKSLGLHTQTGEVDAETVVALNRLMAEKELIDALGKDGALTQALAVTGTLAKRLGDEGALVKALGDEGALIKTLNQLNAAKAIVRGQVRQLNGKPLAACKVRAFLVSDEGKFALGEDASDFEGNYTIRYERPVGVESARLAVIALDASGHALCESVVVEDPGPQAHIDVEVAPSTKPAVAHWIEGSICLADGRPAKGLPLRLYRLGFGGKVDPTPLAASTTDDRGGYVFPFDPTQGGGSVEIRAVDEEGNEITLSAPLCRAFGGDRTTVNLMAPSTLQPLEPEYERLRHALLPQVYDSMANLAGAREAKDRQDFTVLNRATGWDARLIALAAVAEKLAADPDLKEAGVPPDVLYGMLRVGLPSDKALLAQVEPAVVSKALKKARDAGVVNLANDAITENENRFASFVTRSYLKRKALGSPSTYGELLNLTLPGQDAQEKFARICLKHGSNTERLWDEVRSAALFDEPSETEQLIAKLKLHGKLGLVTVNNAPMIKHLLDRGIQAAADLVTQNLHTAVAWRTEILAAAGIPDERHARLTAADLRTLASFIPAVYKGAKVTNRLDAYAHDMARKMRISYPTEVLTQLIDTDPHFKLISDHEATVKLLKAASAQGFRLGTTPVSGFLRSREGFRADLADDDFQLAVQQLKGLQRIYQITPDNESIAVLNRLNVTSASDVMTFNQNEFEERFSSEYRSLYEKPAPKNTVELIIRKSQQISNISLNVISILTRFGSEPTIYGLSAPDKVREDVREELLKHYPTMESLFGSMDFCECEHCRSVLSPAAYLVDLLQFIDNGESPTPFEELIKRRPDIPYIALTCENTNVTLPYIDLINEILEYYVANEELSKDAANDTGEADTEDLLAEPKFVISRAYDKLRNDIIYPLQLPFDLWLETVRSLCIQLQVPLSRVLEVMAPDEDCFATITAPTNDVNATLCLDDADAPKFKSVQSCTYFRAAKNEPSGEVKKIVDIGPPGSGGTGKSLITLEGVWEVEPQDNDLLVHRPIENRESIFMESLGLSPKEVEIFTDKDLLERWHDLYGFASPEEATENRIEKETGQRVDLNSAKALSRRLGVTYKEITEIIQTGFVNPGLKRLAGIQRIGISLRDIRLYRKECGLYQANPDLLDQDFGALDQTARKALEKLKNRRPDSAVSHWQVVNEVASIEKRVKEYVECFPSPPFDQSPTVLQKILNEIKTLKIDDILVLNDAGTGCDFDQTILQYADGRKAKDIDFLRINLFVRLWRKLGWSIEDTDRALITFIPSAAPFKANTLNKQPLRTALIYLAHLKTLDEKLKVGKQSRIKLLTLWSEIQTTGKKSLYEELFLKRDVLEKSPVFDHPLGDYLAESSAKIIDHVLALQGALGLAAEEIGLILSDAGKSPNDAPLSLGNVSLLYRYSLLAKALKLSVRELILLRQISGLQPFEPLHPDPLSSIDEDYPFCQTLEFVKVMEEVKDSGFELDDLDYLLRHRFDETGKYRPDRQGTLVYLKSIFDGVSAIRTEYAVPGDADSVTEEELRQKLGLALAPDVVDRLLGMVNGTAEFTSSTLGVKSHGVLPQWCAGAASIESVFYDESNKTQGISYRGVLFDEDKLALQNKFNPELTSSQRDVLQKLLVRLQETAQASVTQDFTATASNVSPIDALPSDAGDEIVRMDYDPNEKVQKLKCKGILSDLKRRELREGMSPKLTPQQMSILDRLLGGIKAQIKDNVRAPRITRGFQ